MAVILIHGYTGASDDNIGYWVGTFWQQERAGCGWHKKSRFSWNQFFVCAVGKWRTEHPAPWALSDTPPNCRHFERALTRAAPEKRWCDTNYYSIDTCSTWEKVMWYKLLQLNYTEQWTNSARLLIWSGTERICGVWNHIFSDIGISLVVTGQIK